MEHTSELVLRILRDIDDSVLALDQQGHVIYMNPQCRDLLDLHESDLGKTYAEVFFDVHQQENDAFHQFIIDAVYQKEETHCGTVTFTGKSNKTTHLRIVSSFLNNEGTTEPSGVVLVLSDITEAEILKKKRYDASIVFSCVTACVCLYLLLLATLDFLQFNVPTKALTQVINAMVFVIGVIIYKKTDFSPDELGLKIHNYKQTFGSALIVSCLAVILLIAAKFTVAKVAPNFFATGSPFWNWDIGLYSWVSYIFTCIVQEFLARSMIYGSIKKMYDGKHATMAAVFLSSLLFGAVHIAHGFIYMSAAILLLGSLSGLYEKHRNIWGVTIIHFILGQAACCLGFIT